MNKRNVKKQTSRGGQTPIPAAHLHSRSRINISIPSPSIKNLLLVSFGLIAITLFVYAPSWHYGFLSYDDPLYVSGNVEVSHGLTGRGVLWAFTAGHAANWHPLTWLSHMLDVQFYGMVAERHHLTNVLFHIANALLLFWLLCRTTNAWRRSAMVAFLFAVHPLHVESVAWIAERKDVLSALFWMLTFHVYVSYARRPLLRRNLAVIAIFSLGLMAKPMLVPLPITLLLFDIWPLHRVDFGVDQRRVWLQLFREKIPLFAIAVISSIVTIIVQWRAQAVQTFTMLPFSQRAANAVISYIAYIAQMMWPRNLLAYYSRETTSGLLLAICILILLFVSALIIRFAKRHPFLLTGWIWYLCTLLPVIGLIQVGDQSRADRYTYVPLIGIFIIVVWGVPKLFEGRRYRKIILATAASILICALTLLAREQVRFWENDISLWGHVVNAAPRNYFARFNLGNALVARGDFSAATYQYTEALSIKPDFADAHNALGVASFQQGLWQEAATHYADALRVKPGSAKLHSNLGTALGVLGRTEEAVSEFLTALKIDPQKAEIHYNLGYVLAQQGKIDEAIARYRSALQINPIYAEAHIELGNALLGKEEFSKAAEQYTKALEIKPDLADTHNNLGLALMKQGRYSEALFQFKEALRLNPDNVEALKNLEMALEKQ
jgi:protein O-mannosyl-transferase